jgi:hypothetical protein
MRECYIIEDGVGLTFINIEAFNILFQHWRSWGDGLYHKKYNYNGMIECITRRKSEG